MEPSRLQGAHGGKYKNDIKIKSRSGCGLTSSDRENIQGEAV
jgi:hypothetical protein